MILDLRFNDAPPMQYQNVRMTTVYTLQDDVAPPELVIHFYDAMYPQVNISLSRIVQITFTND